MNDAPLPEFKLDLTTIGRLFATHRPLKRERKAVREGWEMGKGNERNRGGRSEGAQDDKGVSVQCAITHTMTGGGRLRERK